MLSYFILYSCGTQVHKPKCRLDETLSHRAADTPVPDTRSFQASCHQYWIIFVISTDTAKPWCSRWLSFIITGFNNTVLTLHDWFQQIRTRTWLLSLASGKITLSSVKAQLWLSDTDTFVPCELWHVFNGYMQPESVGILLTTNLHTLLCFLNHSTFLLLIFHRFLEPNRHFALKVNLMFVTVLLVPMNPGECHCVFWAEYLDLTEAVIGGWRTPHNGELHDLYSLAKCCKN
jgi:hypothetical protein